MSCEAELSQKLNEAMDKLIFNLQYVILKKMFLELYKITLTIMRAYEGKIACRFALLNSRIEKVGG